jgi:site-specific DNA-methyltransferase (adenine-specific)
MNVTDKIRLFHIDNMEFMNSKPDGYYDLAIVDPPYSSSNILGGYTSGKGGGVSKQKKYHNELWSQKAPNKEYFEELIRVSKNVIIWGANHFIENIPKANSSCWVVWNKVNGENSFADCELAWTNLDTAVRLFEFKWQGMLQGDMKNKETRIHPTQKPVALYKWLLDKYAKPNDKILDTHGGSMSIAIACHDYGFELDLCELDKEYYDKGVERVKNHVNQLKVQFPD